MHIYYGLLLDGESKWDAQTIKPMIIEKIHFVTVRHELTFTDTEGRLLRYAMIFDERYPCVILNCLWSTSQKVRCDRASWIPALNVCLLYRLWKDTYLAQRSLLSRCASKLIDVSSHHFGYHAPWRSDYLQIYWKENAFQILSCLYVFEEWRQAVLFRASAFYSHAKMNPDEFHKLGL